MVDSLLFRFLEFLRFYMLVFYWLLLYCRLLVVLFVVVILFVQLMLLLMWLYSVILFCVVVRLLVVVSRVVVVVMVICWDGFLICIVFVFLIWCCFCLFELSFLVGLDRRMRRIDSVVNVGSCFSFLLRYVIVRCWRYLCVVFWIQGKF